jgi:hypothetical protein
MLSHICDLATAYVKIIKSRYINYIFMEVKEQVKSGAHPV